MKTKIITKTYMRDIEKYRCKLFLDEDDYYICVKRIIKAREKFIISNGLCVMDDNYYVFEVIPKNENYAMRIFIDDKLNDLEYYFDICKNNRLDSDTNIPCYDDLYLDITYCDGNVNILDEDELIDAYNNGDITREEFDLVYRVKDEILPSIENKNNKLMNIDYKKYIYEF